jgi:signal transduction histidine kinase/ligand-binding sensor domain-containing protein
MACCPCASALNPSLAINQYAHTAWTVREGFFKGTIQAIAQTPDGYLWLGTEFGLLRFDGVRRVPWQPPAGELLPGDNIRSLLAARDGRLWIGASEGLASWKNGKLTLYPQLAGQRVFALLEDSQGEVWAGADAIPTGRLCAFNGAGTRCYGEDGSLGRGVTSLYEDGHSNLWVGAATGLWQWTPGRPQHFPMQPSAAEINAMTEGDNSALLIARAGGIEQLAGGKAEAYPLPDAARQFNAYRMLRDRDGGLWIGTADRGLMHVHHGRTDLFTRSDGLSGDFVVSLFEDREGNIWVATLDGLDRFHNFAVPTISVKQGLSNNHVWSVLAAMDGSVWLGTAKGLNRWHGGQITVYRKRSARAVSESASESDAGPAPREITDSGLPDDVVESLSEDDRGRVWISTPRAVAYFENGRFHPVSALPGGVVHSICGDRAGNIWINYQHPGLFHLVGGSLVERIPWTTLGHPDLAAALVPDPMQGGLWLGFLQGGVAYLKDGEVRAQFGDAEGLGRGRVNSLHVDGEGTLWAATEGGLSRVKKGLVATLTSRNGLPCDAVQWAMEDDDHSLWLYTACGLVRIGRPELEAWTADSKRTIKAVVFDSSDGVRSHPLASGYSPQVARSTDGRLWFLPLDGVSVIDPRHLPANKLPPPVQIERITVDRKTYETPSQLHLPPLVRDISIDYTALSLVAPEKVHFRYKLEGQDPDWKEVVNIREAQYSNLSPRHYRFRVTACNNSGVWNEAGASFDFSIAPAYYQTTWFPVSLAAAFLASLWALHQYRLRQIAQEFAVRLEERVNERTRIARELHDTLLQALHGLLFRFQAARNMLPRRTEDAMHALDGALTRTEQAIAESRDAIQDLREPGNRTDLAHVLAATSQELLDLQDAGRDSAIFRVTIEGERQTLSPILHDEICQIASEVLRNAFRHAHAHRIEAEIRYEHYRLRLRIRDDGRGIDPKILNDGGRAGHWGLPGVRERAKRIGARLDFWSEAGAGTEVELTVPGSVAYETYRMGLPFGLFGGKKGKS